MSGLRRRVRRLKRTRPSKRPENFDSLDPLEQLTWYAKQGRLTELVCEMEAANKAEREAKAAERAARDAQEPRRESEPAAEAVPPVPVEPKPAPPAEPFRARYPGEPDPNAVPPQNQYWEEKCRFRVRGPEDVYADEPERDELDELIYG